MGSLETVEELPLLSEGFSFFKMPPIEFAINMISAIEQTRTKLQTARKIRRLIIAFLRFPIGFNIIHLKIQEIFKFYNINIL